MATRSPRYEFTDKAERDLESIIDYTVQEWRASQANTYPDGLESRTQLLAENPDIGMVRESLSNGLLSFPFERHILYYKKQTHGIVIVRILPQHMDPVKHL